MAVTDQQKLDFLLKKIGYTKTKTGSVVGTGAISGTPKQPFAEAIPSPLVVPNSSLWNEAGSIPATPPGSDTNQVKVYLAASSGLRMTADSTSSGQRAYIAYSTYGNSSSTRLTNWIDTQFGSAYLIKVYKGDPNSGGVALSAAGSGANDGWFFDYSAGVLNFNDTSVPSGVTDTNIYIVGYRYIGQTGAPTSGISTFSYLDLFVERNLSVGGISTFSKSIQIPDGGSNINQGHIRLGDDGDLKIFHNGNNSYIQDTGTGSLRLNSNNLEIRNAADTERLARFVEDGQTELYYDNTKRFETTNTGINVIGDGVFSGNVSIAGTLTYEDAKNVDSVGLITARSGIRVTGGVIEAQAGENKIPSLYAAMGNLPSAGSYHGMFAHVHATARGYFAHAGNWLELVNKETNGVVGTGTETYNIGNLVSVSSTATSFNVTGVTTVVTLDVNGDLDVDGHTNLDNVSVAGVSTFAGITTVTGNTLFTKQFNVSGVSTFFDDVNIPVTNKKLKIGASGQLQFYNQGYHSRIDHVGNHWLSIRSNAIGLFDASDNYFLDCLAASGAVRLYKSNSIKLTTTNTGITVTGTVVADGADINGDLDVDGHTNLDNVSIAGVTTFTGNIGGTATFNDIDVDGHTNLDNVSIAGVTTGTTINATTFVGNGDFVELDVDGHTNLDNVSIAGFTTITQDLDVDGHTNLDNVSISGVSTFSGKIGVHDGTTGANGQYLRATGAGVTWANFPTMRTGQTFTASAGQTTFSFTYNVGFLDVYVNGIKLSSSEFTATNGSSVVLAVGCFVGDIVELVSFFTTSYAAGSEGGSGISNVVEDTSPQLGGNLDLFNKSITGTGNINMTGVATATKFVGDGSGLTGVTGSGSGVAIRNSGSVVGTAGTIDFGSNISVSAISAGIVTITGSVGITTNSGVVSIVNDLDVDGHTNLDNVTIAGVVTATTFVGALTGNVTGNVTGNATGLSGNPSINVTDLDVDGHTNLDNVSVAGVTTFTGAISASDIRSNALTLKNAAGSASYAVFSNGGSALLKHNNTDRLETSASGVTVTGTVSATAFSGDGSALTGISGVGTADVRTNTLNVIGVSTVGVLTVTGNADIDGHTELDGVNIAGVATFRNPIVAMDVINATNIKRTSGALQIQSSSTEFKSVDGTVGFATVNNSGVQVTGVITATNFVGDGSGLTGITASGSGVVVKNSGSTVGTAGTINFGDNLSVSAISGGAVTITGSAGVSTSQFDVNKLDVSGISTFKGNIDVNADLDVDGHTNLDNVSISGIVTTSGGLNVSSGILDVATSIRKSSGSFDYLAGAHIFSNVAGSTEFFRFASSGQFGIGGENYGSSGQVLTSQGSGSAPTWATVSSGITTNLSGSFTASAGSAATINTFGYGSGDIVVEYTIFIKNGSDFQSQKLLAMRDGTTIHSTQFAVMFSSSLLVQCDATISSGNILLRATPETGVSGSTTYKVKREVM